MNVAEIVRYLRISVKLQDPSIDVRDESYLSISDEDLELILKVVCTRDFPKVRSLDRLPAESVYPVTLLAKKELYFALATSEAPFYDLVADNNNQLKRAQRFEHYMEMIAQVDKEYNQYNKDGGAGTRNTLSSFDVLLPNRYASKRNYEKGVVPALSLYVDSVTSTTIELSWEVSISLFLHYKVYILDSPIWDEYKEGDKLSEKAELVTTIHDVHQTLCRIEGLEPNTLYHVLVVATDKTSLKGVDSIEVETEPI